MTEIPHTQLRNMLDLIDDPSKYCDRGSCIMCRSDCYAGVGFAGSTFSGLMALEDDVLLSDEEIFEITDEFERPGDDDEWEYLMRSVAMM